MRKYARPEANRWQINLKNYEKFTRDLVKCWPRNRSIKN